jgi:hypothetical protein
MDILVGAVLAGTVLVVAALIGASIDRGDRTATAFTHPAPRPTRDEDVGEF